METRTLLAASLLTLLGCAHMQPGQGLSDDFAMNWGCDPAEVRAEAERLDQRLESGKVYVPQPGWTACELLAHNGQPDRVDRQSTRRSQSASWWYEIKDLEGYTTDMKLIRLDYQIERARDGGTGWVVDYVGW